MNSIEIINRLPPPSDGHPWSAASSVHASSSKPPTVGARLDEILPLLDVIPEAGPPVLFVLGPWLFVVLMLIGPFVLLFTMVLAAVIFVAVTGAMFALPYLLVHHLRKLRLPHHAPHLSLRRLRILHHHPQPDVTSNGM